MIRVLCISIFLFLEIIDTKSWIFEKHVIEMEVSGVFRSAVRGKIEEKIQKKRGEGRRPVNGSLSPNGNFSFQRDERAASRPRNAKIVTFSRAAA